MQIGFLGFLTLLFAVSVYSAITTKNALGKFFSISFAVVSAGGVGALLWDQREEARRQSGVSRFVKQA